MLVTVVVTWMLLAFVAIALWTVAGRGARRGQLVTRFASNRRGEDRLPR